MQYVHFVDISRLQTFVTSDWSEWGTKRLITRSDIGAFGTLTDNHQWIHEDDARCGAESIYGGVIAHGLFILTLLPSLLPLESFQVVGHTHRIVRGGQWRFPAPVFPENTLHARARLVKVRYTERGTLLIRETEIWSSGNKDKPVVTCKLRLQYF
jgi:acyl dehydratase